MSIDFVRFCIFMDNFHKFFTKERDAVPKPLYQNAPFPKRSSTAGSEVFYRAKNCPDKKQGSLYYLLRLRLSVLKSYGVA